MHDIFLMSILQKVHVPPAVLQSTPRGTRTPIWETPFYSEVISLC